MICPFSYGFSYGYVSLREGTMIEFDTAVFKVVDVARVKTRHPSGKTEALVGGVPIL